MIEVLKQMQKALREYHYYTIDAGLPNQSMLNKGYAAYQAGLKAIAELESQEPVAVYGYCPECGAKGVMRERRPDGNDKCANGHTYQSCKATHPPQRTWVGLAPEDRLTAKYMQDAPNGIEAVIDYIETKLKEKNT
jgi:hypothetical protein